MKKDELISELGLDKAMSRRTIDVERLATMNAFEAVIITRRKLEAKNEVEAHVETKILADELEDAAAQGSVFAPEVTHHVECTSAWAAGDLL